MDEAKFLIELATGIFFTIIAAIVVVWCVDRLCRLMWRDGDPKEPN